MLLSEENKVLDYPAAQRSFDQFGRFLFGVTHSLPTTFTANTSLGLQFEQLQLAVLVQKNQKSCH